MLNYKKERDFFEKLSKIVNNFVNNDYPKLFGSLLFTSFNISIFVVDNICCSIGHVFQQHSEGRPKVAF